MYTVIDNLMMIVVQFIARDIAISFAEHVVGTPLFDSMPDEILPFWEHANQSASWFMLTESAAYTVKVTLNGAGEVSFEVFASPRVMSASLEIVPKYALFNISTVENEGLPENVGKILASAAQRCFEAILASEEDPSNLINRIMEE